jgi:hypothetical protein
MPGLHLVRRMFEEAPRSRKRAVGTRRTDSCKERSGSGGWVTGNATRSGLEFRLRPRVGVHTTIHEEDPFELAEGYADYAFKFAKQFVRRRPFILIFVIHPWLGGLRFKQNFASFGHVFMRSFARRTFMQFRTDKTKIFAVTRARASRLLSGMMFIDASQVPSSNAPVHGLYLNPYAKHPISELTRDHLRKGIPNMSFDDFRHDTY